MDKKEILDILDNAKDDRGDVPMRLVRQALDKLSAIQPISSVQPEPDCVSRQAAIDALDCINGVEEVLRALPTVYPDHNADVSKKAEGDCISRQAVVKFFNDWISCLDENCHHQSVADMTIIKNDFKNLPSVQPKQVCVATVTLTDEQVKEAVEKAKNAVISVIEPEPHWTPCSKRMPEEHEWIGTKTFGTTISDEVYVTFESPKGERFTKHLSFQNGKVSSFTQREIDVFYKGAVPIAWKPLPEPYKGGEEE